MDYGKVLNPVIVKEKPSGIRRFFDIASTMEDCIVLGVGEPDFKTPWSIREAGITSLEKGRTFYTSNSGLAPLRVEICKYLKRRFDLDYSDDEVMVTVGGSEGIDVCMRATLCPGDEVIVPFPSYVSYGPMARLAGASVVPIDTKAENSFRITAEELKAAITPKTKLLVLPYPSNPTGAVMRREHLEEIADVLRGTDILIMSDEIYAELTYGDTRHVSIASIDGMKERTILINGFSKAHAMTGWRLGYACAPKPILQQMIKIHQFAIMSAPTTSQYAAIAALSQCDEQVEEMRTQYNLRRKFLTSELKRIGLPSYDAEGTFYVFADIRASGLSSEEFCEKLMYSRRVVVVPGTAFGDAGEGFVRISYSYSIDHIQQALVRIEAFMQDIKDGKID
ncbi:MAG: aminotransferase class I/II-fold pyridoxal phosphate-dependent enzyme [Oscillospiraceae bacterium]|nr:aminotransferase class I/II-fold pyridoxal phosphate-dependent enzyme [Oscillospiraceae bacterium]